MKIGPSGGSLFVVMKLADVKFGEAVLRVIPYLLVLWLEIFIIASFPQVLLKMMM